MFGRRPGAAEVAQTPRPRPAAVPVAAPAAVQSGRFDPAHVAASFLFLPARHPVLGHLEPVLVPSSLQRDKTS